MFGSHVTAKGGKHGTHRLTSPPRVERGGLGGSFSNADFGVRGSDGGPLIALSNERVVGGMGGASYLGASVRAERVESSGASAAGNAGIPYGGGKDNFC